MSSSQYIEKIVKGAFLVLISLALGKLFSYLYVILVATKLGSHEYGLLSLGLAIVSFLNAFALLGLDEGIIRFVSFYKGKENLQLIKSTIKNSFKTVLNASLFMSLLLIVFSDFISNNIFNEYTLEKVLFFMAIGLPFGALAHVFLVSFRAFQKPEYEVLIKEVLEKSLRLIITLILILFGFKLLGALAGFLIAIIIMFLVSVFAFNKKITNVFSKDFEPVNNKKELLNYSLPLLLKNFMWFIIAWTDLLMIGYFKTTSDVGIYNVALPTSNLIIIPAYGIMYLFLPIISELYAKNNFQEIKNIYTKISKYILLINIPIFLILSLLSKDLILFLFGQEYVKAAAPLTILSIGYLIYSLSDISMNMLSVLKKTKTIFFIILIFALTNIILNYILIPRYSLTGASIATSTSFLFGAILIVSVSYYHNKLHPFMFNFLKIISSLIITLIIALLLKSIFSFKPLINIILFIFIILVAYLFILKILKVLDKEDLELIREIKNKILKY